MTAFVLVHGAWHGGWAWERVSPLLEEAGATVSAPTLTGDRPESEPTRQVGLGTHVEDVLRALDALTGERATLVGHSYAGLVVREAADRRPERVERIVLVDGWAGADGSSMFSLAPHWFAEGTRKAAEEGGDGWLIPAPHPAVFGITEPEDARWLAARLRPQPLRTFTEPTRLGGAVDEIPGTAICCTPETLPFAGLAEQLGYQLVSVEGPHDVMLSGPDLLAEQLLEPAGRT